MIITDGGVASNGVETVTKQKKLVLLFAKIALVMISIELAVEMINIATATDDANLISGMAYVYTALIYTVVMLIPACAIGGVKQQNPGLLCCSCVFSGICAAFSFLNFVGFTLFFIGSTAFFDTPGMATSNSIGIAAVLMLYSFVMGILWVCSATANYKLHNTMQVAVVVISPPQQETIPVAVQVVKS